MWMARKKTVHRMLFLIGLSDLFLLFVFFLNGMFQYNPLKVSIYTTIVASWNFLSIVSIAVIQRIGRQQRSKVAK
jgi:hypothetical protein